MHGRRGGAECDDLNLSFQTRPARVLTNWWNHNRLGNNMASLNHMTASEPMKRQNWRNRVGQLLHLRIASAVQPGCLGSGRNKASTEITPRYYWEVVLTFDICLLIGVSLNSNLFHLFFSGDDRQLQKVGAQRFENSTLPTQKDLTARAKGRQQTNLLSCNGRMMSDKNC